MTRLHRPYQYTIAQLAAAIAGIAVLLAIFRISMLLGLAALSFCLYVMQRIRPPRKSFVRWAGNFGALLGLVFGAFKAANLTSWFGSPMLAVLYALGVALEFAFAGALVGQVITIVLNPGQRPEPRRRRELPDPIEVRRVRLITEYETLEQLIIQAEKDGDNEVLTKLTTYRSKLKADLAL
jgi:hypothetical protein